MTTGSNKRVEIAITVYIDQGLEEIVPGFLENRRRDVRTLETALHQNDLKTIHIIGHRMKGDGGGYGFDAISMMGAALELAAAREDRDAIRRHTAELTDFLARVTVVYRTFREEQRDHQHGALSRTTPWPSWPSLDMWSSERTTSTAHTALGSRGIGNRRSYRSCKPSQK